MKTGHPSPRPTAYCESSLRRSFTVRTRPAPDDPYPYSWVTVRGEDPPLRAAAAGRLPSRRGAGPGRRPGGRPCSASSSGPPRCPPARPGTAADDPEPDPARRPPHPRRPIRPRDGDLRIKMVYMEIFGQPRVGGSRLEPDDDLRSPTEREHSTRGGPINRTGLTGNNEYENPDTSPTAARWSTKHALDPTSAGRRTGGLDRSGPIKPNTMSCRVLRGPLDRTGREATPSPHTFRDSPALLRVAPGNSRGG